MKFLGRASLVSFFALFASAVSVSSGCGGNGDGVGGGGSASSTSMSASMSVATTGALSTTATTSTTSTTSGTTTSGTTSSATSSTTSTSSGGTVCTPATTQSCYDGPANTKGVGICKAGTKTCNAQGTAYGACTGQVLPAAAEDCSTTADDNCNGQ